MTGGRESTLATEVRDRPATDAARVERPPASGPPRARGRSRLRPSRSELLAAAVSGALFAVAFPPSPGAPLALVCLVPLAVRIGRAADDGERAGVAARVGVWFAIVGFGLALYWIAVALSLFTSLAFLAYLATLVGMAILVAGTTTALYVARRRTRWPLAILLPATWVTLEILLAYLSDLAFPWFPLGLAVARLPALAQVADLSGVHGVSVWIAATNGLLADAWLHARAGDARRAARSERDGGGRWRGAWARVALAAALAGGVWAYGLWRLATVPVRPLARIGIVQPDIPEDEKMQVQMRDRFVLPLAALTRLEESGASRPPQLVLWPETALPDFLVNHPDWTDSLQALARTGHAPILFGLIDYTITGPGPGDFDYFNAATVVDTSGRIGVQPAYHKAYLVPIVERVPFINPRWFAGLKYFGGFGRGTGAVPFTFPFGRVGVLICYESIFPQLSRRDRRAGADLLVNLTNDAWFGTGTAPYQHEAHLRLRAIENRVGVVRAANTGISEYIDPLGRPHGATALFVRAARVYDAGTSPIDTLYDRWGDWLGGLCVALTVTLLAAAAAAVVRRRRRP